MANLLDRFCTYPLAVLQFEQELGHSFGFDITLVIGFTNKNAISKK